MHYKNSNDQVIEMYFMSRSTKASFIELLLHLSSTDIPGKDCHLLKDCHGLLQASTVFLHVSLPIPEEDLPCYRLHLNTLHADAK